MALREGTAADGSIDGDVLALGYVVGCELGDKLRLDLELGVVLGYVVGCELGDKLRLGLELGMVLGATLVLGSEVLKLGKELGMVLSNGISSASR